MSRPLVALASVVLAGLGFVVLLPDCASACTCRLVDRSQKEIVESELLSLEAVFSGEVVDFEKWPRPVVCSWCYREALEWRDLSERWIVGVQWHPEGMGYTGPEHRDLFEAHVGAAERHALLRAAA